MSERSITNEAYAIFSVSREKIENWIRFRDFSVSSFVDVDHVLPNTIFINRNDFHRDLEGNFKVDAELPVSIDMSVNVFPIIEIVSPIDLVLIGKSSVGSDPLDAIFGDRAQTYKSNPELALSELDGLKCYATFQAIKQRRWVADDEEVGLKQIFMRKGAERIYRMCRNYRFFQENSEDITRLIGDLSSGNRRISSDRLAARKLAKLPFSDGLFNLDNEAIKDIKMFDAVKFIRETEPQSYDWQSFEEDSANALTDAGFQVQTTQVTGDFGADIVATKDGLTYLVQCKWVSRPVGVSAVQEVVSALRYYVADHAAVVAKNGYTNAAYELARANGVALLDLRSLKNLDFSFG